MQQCWGCVALWRKLHLTFDLAVVTLSLKIWSRLYLRNHKVRKLILSRGHWCGYAMSCCEFDLILDQAVVTLNFKILSGLYLKNFKL